MKYLHFFEDFLLENTRSVYSKLANNPSLSTFLGFLLHGKSHVMDNQGASREMDAILSMVKNEKYNKPLYRGLYIEKAEDFIEGENYVFNRYQSFSQNIKIAEEFTQNNIILQANTSIGGFNYGGYLINYYENLKYNDPMMYVIEDGDSIIDSAKEESEWIFPRGTKFQVEKKVQKGKLLIIQGEIVKSSYWTQD